MAKRPDNPYVVRPVMKALKALELVARQSRAITLTAVSKELRIPKTTTFRYLQTLAEAGFLDHDRVTDKYALGPAMRSIARMDAGIARLRQLARPAMTDLMHEFNETVNLAVRSNSNVVYVDLIEANRSLRMQARIGETHPIHSTALGKAILAFLPGAEQARMLSAPLTERTHRTLIEPKDIERQLRQVVKLGYAVEIGENEDDAMCVGAPIFDDARYPVAAISVSAPLMRMPRALAAKAGARLLDVAREISARLGS